MEEEAVNFLRRDDLLGLGHQIFYRFGTPKDSPQIAPFHWNGVTKSRVSPGWLDAGWTLKVLHIFGLG
jgi:hypothetical protein